MSVNLANWSNSFEDKIHILEKEQAFMDRIPDDGNWSQFTCRGIFAGFACAKCSKTWSSSQCVTELFYRYNPKRKMGEIRTGKEYGQICQRCRVMAAPTFKADETDFAMEKLLLRIKRRFYDPEDDLGSGGDINSNSGARRVRPPLRQGHDTRNCEACKAGICGDGGGGAWGGHRRRNVRQVVRGKAERRSITWTLVESAAQ